MYFFQGPEFGELFFQFPFGCVETESKNTEAVGHIWSIPTSNMPPTVTHGGPTSRPDNEKTWKLVCTGKCNWLNYTSASALMSDEAF